ncbi:MAG: hypothetical protein WA996_02950 [Candidatus Promineifilaceae bacterium]
MNSRLRVRLIGYLPEYVNGTLGSPLKWIVERWLVNDAEALEEVKRLQMMRAMVRVQSQADPSPAIYSKIAATTQSTAIERVNTWRPSLIWIPIVVLLILTGILVWRVLPPGLELQWSVEGEVPTTFRVYRAPAESAKADDFTLIAELDAEDGVLEYGFTDLRLIPGRQFSYRVEGYSHTGQLAISQAMVGDSLEALPGQLLLLFVVGVIGFGIFAAVRQFIPIHVGGERYSIL